MRTWIVLIVMLLFQSCKVDKYINRDGEVFKRYNPNHDVLVDASTISSYPFNLEGFINQDFSDTTVQYINTSDIKEIVKQKDKFLLIYYYPNCPGPHKKGAMELLIAKYAEDINIPYILISETNDMSKIFNWNRLHEFNNQNAYVFPSTTTYSNKLFDKRIQFLKELCEECYENIKDESLNLSLMLFKDYGKTIMTNVDHKDYGYEASIKLINDFMEIDNIN